SVVIEGDSETVSQFPRGRLLMVLARELRALGDCGDEKESLNLLECLRLENVEKAVSLRLMMKETQLKITKIGKFIMQLGGNGEHRSSPYARTTLLLSLPDEHQLRFSKYKTTRELWAAILKTFGGNEATKKRKKNLLKQQYGNFKAEGSESLEQTFNRLQVIVGQLQFIDVKVKHDDLNQKFLTSLALEWLMHTIVWRNRSDLDTTSLDDLYNHLKVSESELQKKSDPNSQNMAFISYANHSSENEDGNTACDINQIDEDDMEEMDIKWSMALLSMRADKFWKKTGKKISIQGSDVAGFDKSKVECFNCHKMGHFARECRAPRSQERGRKDNYRQGSKVDEQTPKALMAIDGRSEKNKEGLGYTAVPPPTAQLYLSPKKDLSWTGLPECADDTVTDYSRPSPTVKSTSEDDQNRNSSASEDVASPITPKPFVKFVKPKDCQSESPDFVMKKKACFNCGDFTHLANDCRKRVKRGTSRSQNNAFKSPSHRPIGHRPYGPPVRPMRSNMNAARPNRTFLIYKHIHMKPDLSFKTTTVKSQFRAPWVPTVNRNNPLLIENFPLVVEIFPLPIGNFPLLAENFPMVEQKFTLLIWEEREKLAVPRTKLMIKAIGTVAALGT
nr:hypothetical protein [Tanacetum cinerariifolium]